jgi:hypothetical protein
MLNDLIAYEMSLHPSTSNIPELLSQDEMIPYLTITRQLRDVTDGHTVPGDSSDSKQMCTTRRLRRKQQLHVAPIARPRMTRSSLIWCCSSPQMLDWTRNIFTGRAIFTQCLLVPDECKVCVSAVCFELKEEAYSEVSDMWR